MKTKLLTFFLFLLLAFGAKTQVNLQTGLVAYYPFNGNANDASGNGNNGTVNGATLTTDRFGNVGKAFSFDGNDMIELPISTPINTNDFTISVWANHNGDCTSEYCFPITKGSNGDYDLLAIYKNIVALGSSSSSFFIQTKNAISINHWYHYLVVRKDNITSFYLDGVLQGSNNTTVNISNNYKWIIGSQNNAVNVHYLAGKIDDIRIYNRALSSEEIAQLYNSEKPATDLTTGLVAYYPFNGNANDESGNGNNGTVNGATLTADRFGNIGKAFSFDGVNDFIQVGIDPIITNQMTISAWVNGKNFKRGIISKSSTGDGRDVDYILGVEGVNLYNQTLQNKAYWQVNKDNGATGLFTILQSEPINQNQYYYLTGIIDYSKNETRLYINSKLVATGSMNNLSVRDTKHILKFGVSDEWFGSYFFNGTIDDIRIYNRALSSDEVTQLYNSEKPATDLTTGLVAYYPFNGNANDESGNGNNGTVNGATLTTDRFGNAGKAYSFDGVNDYIVVPDANSLDFGTGDFTVSTWLKYPSQVGGTHNYSAIFIKSPTQFPWDGITCFVDFESGTGKVNFRVKYNGDLSSNTSNLNNNNWYKLTCVRQSDVLKIYINGVLDSFIPATQLNITNDQSLYFGANQENQNNQNFQGLMDDIRIYNRALSSDEVTELYNSEKPATDLTTGLVAYFPFNGNANDESGNGNNGTVNGATLTADRFGNVGKAYGFTGGYVRIENNNFPIGNNPRSVSAWVRANLGTSSSGAGRDIILYGSSQNNAAILRFWNKNTCAIGVEFTNNSVIKEFSTDFNVDEWYNIAYTYDGNKCLLFLNGTLIGQNNSLAFLTEQGSAYIGRAYTNWGADNLFNGDIDDIRIYSRALSTEEIRYLYSGQQNIKLDAPTDIQYRTTKISNSTNIKTTLIWKSVTGAKIYEVYKDGALLGKTFSTIFYDENPAGNYKYQIASVNANGKSPLSLPCNVSVSGTNTVAGYGSLAIYITDVNKQKVENALIQFTDGSTAQTLKTGFVLLKNIPYGTTKTISRIVKSGWDFTDLNGSSFSCSKSKPSMVLKYTATTTPGNEPTMETFNPQYSSELVIVSDGDITLPTFTKGQDFTLDMKIASTSQYWWNGNIRLKAVRKGVEAGKTYPTYYIAQLNDVKVPLEGKMIRFTANESQLSAEAGNYELYVEAQTKEVFRQGYFILKRGKVAESTTNSDTQFKTDISVGDNLNFETNMEALVAISDAIKETTGIYDMFGDLVKADNQFLLIGKIGNEIKSAFDNFNPIVKEVEVYNSKIQFFKDIRELSKENDDIIRSFKIINFVIDKATSGDPMAKIFKNYLDVAQSLTSAIERISNGINDATNGMVINEHPIYLKVKKDTNGWRSFLNIYGGDYFESSEFNMHIAKAEVFSNKPGSQRFTLPIEKDNTDSKRLKIKTDGLQDLQFDTGEKVFLKLTFSNKRKLIIPLNSDFVKFDGLYGAITFVLGTNTTIATEIPEKIKIIEP